MPKCGRPPHRPTDESRKFVKAMVSAGVHRPMIASVVGISETTLRKHYARELEIGDVEANTTVASTLYGVATDRDHPRCVTAGIFWMKARAGWSDGAREHVGKKDAAQQAAQAAGKGSDWGDDLAFSGDKVVKIRR